MIIQKQNMRAPPNRLFGVWLTHLTLILETNLHSPSKSQQAAQGQSLHWKTVPTHLYLSEWVNTSQLATDHRIKQPLIAQRMNIVTLVWVHIPTEEENAGGAESAIARQPTNAVTVSNGCAIHHTIQLETAFFAIKTHKSRESNMSTGTRFRKIKLLFLI